MAGLHRQHAGRVHYPEQRARCRIIIMHRKSAYILFLAVLGLLVIGIVMLFSTSAFARDSHGDVYFFIKRQAVWFWIRLVICNFASLIYYHFWQRHCCLWFAFALVP